MPDSRRVVSEATGFATGVNTDSRSCRTYTVVFELHGFLTMRRDGDQSRWVARHELARARIAHAAVD